MSRRAIDPETLETTSVRMTLRSPDGTLGEDYTLGVIAPHTERTFALHVVGHPGHWVITHRPSGFCIPPKLIGEQATLEDVVGIAERLYRELMRYGAPLELENPMPIVAVVNNMTKEHRVAFWLRVLGKGPRR